MQDHGQFIEPLNAIFSVKLRYESFIYFENYSAKSNVSKASM